ncbi:MAG: ion transporter [Mariprofundus sp.]|nr:ion transporter [Mariprofundus sp.]
MDEATRKALEAMQKEADAEQAAANSGALTEASEEAETPMQRMQREALEEQAAADAGTVSEPALETETPMQRMQREALEEQAAADGGSTAAMSMQAMQDAALAEQSTADQSAAASVLNIRDTLNRYLFDMNTTGGKVVNYGILVLIIATVFISMFNTVPNIHAQWGDDIFIFQMGVLYVFLFEYVLRIYAAKERKKYVFGFYGMIDFLTVLPLAFGSPGSAIMRLFRLLRIMKLAQYFPVLTTLLRSVSDAVNMILAVLATITAVSIFAGNLAYMLEPETFGNAFIGAWWSLVTMSTVGYGDLVPHSSAGMLLGGVLILVGICVVAMMTAVIAVRVGRMVNMTNVCLACDKPVSSEHNYCPHCGQDQSDEIDLFTDDE